MKIYKENENATLPVFATAGSACFDLMACIDKDTKIKSYGPYNKETSFPAKLGNGGKFCTAIPPQFRMLIPTGLIFDVPENQVLKLYTRSGMALKFGLRLANSTAIIDSDYIDQTYIMMFNDGDTPITVFHGDRLAQGMLETVLEYTLEETHAKPKQKTNRTGGLGSTGTAEINLENFAADVPAQKRTGRQAKQIEE